MIDFKKKHEEDEKLQHKGSKNVENKKLEGLVITKKKRKVSHILIFVIVISIIFSGKIIMSSPSTNVWLEQSGLFNKIKHLTTSLDRKLDGEDKDRINILLLGMGGEGHDGAYLTDTIILASLKPSTGEAAMMSFPRDLVSPVSNWQKINSINAYAEYKEEGSGGEAVMKSMSELLNIDIDYYARIDFSGFAKIIDEIGGIEIEVENTFDDYRYPIYGEEDNPNYYARFEHLHFDAGLQKMNGSTALKYARSRHAYGLEGSDYARAKRQQLVIEAVKNKLLSASTLLNPVTIGKLVDEFNSNISTNVEIWEMLRLWNLSKDVNRENITNFVFNDAPDNYLVSSRSEEGAFILLPKSGSFDNIRSFVANIFPENLDGEENTEVKSFATSKTITSITGTSSVVVLNGTWITGLAGRKSAVAKQAGFSIMQVANAPERDYSNSVIYDLSDGEKKNSLKILANLIGATESDNLPNWAIDYTIGSSSPDLILVLGSQADTKY